MSIRNVGARAAIRAVVGAGTLAVVTGSVAYAHHGHRVARPHETTPEEIAAFEAAKPAFEHHCFPCHTTNGKEPQNKALAHIMMDGYPFAGLYADDAGAVVRKVLGMRGVHPTMPPDDPGTVTGEDLARICDWADAYEAARVFPKEKPSGGPVGDSSHGNTGGLAGPSRQRASSLVPSLRNTDQAEANVGRPTMTRRRAEADGDGVGAVRPRAAKHALARGH